LASPLNVASATSNCDGAEIISSEPGVEH
jgi:hypothetical protein